MVALQYWWLHTDWTSLMLLMSLTDFPKDMDDYVHRIGRSGRAGKSGLATAFFCVKNLPLTKALVELMQESNQEVPSWLNQHAERSTSVGHGKCYRAGRFGGYAYRNAQSRSENYNYSSNYEGPDSSFDASIGSSYGAFNAGAVVVVNTMLLKTQIHMLLVDMEKAMNRQLPLAGIRALLRSLSFALTYI